MKLIVQIPCYNEEETLARTVADIPRDIDGIDGVEILIVDDGSTDDTVGAARRCGVDHVVRHRRNKGLAYTFATGIDAALRLGADIVVNTDGDNQYPGRFIPDLIRPIVSGDADIVIGDRQSARNPHFSPLKKLLQRLGSNVVRRLSGTDVPDAVSGFRAISREAALRLNIVSTFSYTIEMVIQAGNKRMAIASVPIETNEKTRESRLFGSIPGFIWRSATTMLRMYAMYRPLRAFMYIGALFFIVGALPIVRFLYFYMTGGGGGHIQSLILGGSMVILGVTTWLFGLMADLISFNRRLLESTLEKVRRLELMEDLAPKAGEQASDPLERIRRVAASLNGPDDDSADSARSTEPVVEKK